MTSYLYCHDSNPHGDRLLLYKYLLAHVKNSMWCARRQLWHNFTMCKIHWFQFRDFDITLLLYLLSSKTHKSDMWAWLMMMTSTRRTCAVALCVALDNDGWCEYTAGSHEKMFLFDWSIYLSQQAEQCECRHKGGFCGYRRHLRNSVNFTLTIPQSNSGSFQTLPPQWRLTVHQSWPLIAGHSTETDRLKKEPLGENLPGCDPVGCVRKQNSLGFYVRLQTLCSTQWVKRRSKQQQHDSVGKRSRKSSLTVRPAHIYSMPLTTHLLY